ACDSRGACVLLGSSQDVVLIVALAPKCPASRKARPPRDVTCTKRDRVPAGTLEAGSRKPVTRIRTARPRRDTRCKAPRSRAHARSTLADEDREVARRIVTDAEPC